MFVSSVILAFVLGIVITLLVQYLFVRRWLARQPQQEPPKKQQYDSFQLPKVLSTLLKDERWKRYWKWREQAGRGGGSGQQQQQQERGEEQTLVINTLMQFLFAELKDTTRVRRWAARKLNVEFEDMLATTTGKLMDQIQVRDFNFGSNFPIVKSVDLQNVEINGDNTIQTVDVAVDVVYDGGFQLTLDVDIIFGAWAYLSVKVARLEGRARLQMTRHPFTHWSFSFCEEPKMEFEVDSRFNGRPIPQISSLIVNQIKRTIRKKHVLPSYKMRFKPLFAKEEVPRVIPDLTVRGSKIGRGRLTVDLLGCSRLQEVAADSKLYCTVSVDKEEIEEVWKQSWVLFDVDITKPTPNTNVGLQLKDQLSGDKIEKKRVIVDDIITGSPASFVNLQRGDIIEFIGNVRVLSAKHAVKQTKNCTDFVNVRGRRHQARFLADFDYQEKGAMEVEEKYFDPDYVEDQEDFVNISILDNNKTPENNQQAKPSKPESSKLSEKLSRKKEKGLAILQSGKRKLLGNKEPVDEGESVGYERRKSSVVEEEGAGVGEGASPGIGAAGLLKERSSHSAKSSPQKTLRDLQHRQRAHSDTSLSRASDDSGSLLDDVGCHSHRNNEKRAGEVQTREIPFSTEPEWNEQFEFDCSDEDQFVNVCVWCRIAQNDRNTKQGPSSSASSSRLDGNQPKNTPPVDDLPQYDVTTKLGFASIPLSDVAAGCLLTLKGDTRYTVYLHPPEEVITASRSKSQFAGHPGFDKKICNGDITLAFTFVPFLKMEPRERKRVVSEILNPPPEIIPHQDEEKEIEEGRHKFVASQFPSGTYCHFCGKKIWLKGAFQCVLCKMNCHKKCLEKCHAQTWCTKEGPKIAGRIHEPWVSPIRGVEPDRDNREDKEMKPGTSLFGKLRHRETPSLPLNIPNKSNQVSPAGSPSKQSFRSISPMAPAAVGGAVGMADTGDGQLGLPGIKRTHSSSSVPGLDRSDDSDEEATTPRCRTPGYSLDDTVVIEAKEKGKELFSDLSLPERKKTLDEMVTKLQFTIDKESEYKTELLRSVAESGDADQKRALGQQVEKSDEKMEALMMMMVHYCAGLQHCLDQEEAHRRLQLMAQSKDPTPASSVDDETRSLSDGQASIEDAGIQFVVTDMELDQP